MEKSAVTVENNLVVPLKSEAELYMIQQFHIWVHTQKNSKQGLQQILDTNL